ncbi:hypothetical protein JCM10207_007196 [Rhodosporidiobolus poonsookiae]
MASGESLATLPASLEVDEYLFALLTRPIVELCNLSTLKPFREYSKALKHILEEHAVLLIDASSSVLPDVRFLMADDEAVQKLLGDQVVLKLISDVNPQAKLKLAPGTAADWRDEETLCQSRSYARVWTDGTLNPYATTFAPRAWLNTVQPHQAVWSPLAKLLPRRLGAFSAVSQSPIQLQPAQVSSPAAQLSDGGDNSTAPVINRPGETATSSFSAIDSADLDLDNETDVNSLEARLRTLELQRYALLSRIDVLQGIGQGHKPYSRLPSFAHGGGPQAQAGTGEDPSLSGSARRPTSTFRAGGPGLAPKEHAAFADAPILNVPVRFERDPVDHKRILGFSRASSDAGCWAMRILSLWGDGEKIPGRRERLDQGVAPGPERYMTEAGVRKFVATMLGSEWVGEVKYIICRPALTTPGWDLDVVFLDWRFERHRSDAILWTYPWGVYRSDANDPLEDAARQGTQSSGDGGFGGYGGGGGSDFVKGRTTRTLKPGEEQPSWGAA